MKLTSPFAELFATPEPPELGPGPRVGVKPLQPLLAAIGSALAGTSPQPERQQAARGLVLLWHDHHDAAHRIVQDEETADAAYVHAILHRREPDFGNAKYWVRRVRQHPCYERLAEEAGRILTGREALHSKLLPGGKWDAFAFVDECERANEKSAEVLREIQAAEFTVLLEFLTRP